MRNVVVLPAPLGPSSVVELAGSDAQVEPVHRGPVEALGEAADLEGEGKRILDHRRGTMSGRKESSAPA